MENLIKVVVALILLSTFAMPPAESALDSIGARHVKGPSGTRYLWLYQNNSTIHWTATRPKKEDKSIMLCIPAAFTGAYGGIVGLYVLSGQPFNKPDDKIGGMVVVQGGRCNVLSTPGGKIGDDLLQPMKVKRADCFQQFQVVANGKGERFRDASRFQRRGIAILKDGTTVIIESVEPITLTQFGEDSAALGVEQLAYTDMGPWDEGWYRNPSDGKLITIGQDRSLTGRQSNWLYFESASSPSNKATSQNTIK
jgi:hypothetical protein